MSTEPLSPLEILLIERACERLVLDSVTLNDRQDFEGLATLFDESAVLTRPSASEPLVGKEKILQSYRSRPKARLTRHVCTNIRVTVEGAEKARATSYVLVFSGNADETPEGHLGIRADPCQLVGEFEDDFVRTAEGWKIASRRGTFALHTRG